VTLGKADVVKAWKPELKALGFVYRDIMFQLNETIDQPLHFTISIQRNLHSETYMIHTMILIKSPFSQDSRWQVLVSGKLRPNGIYLHVRNENWWTPESLPEALDGLKRFALPWFREWGMASFLVEKHEIAIRERRSLFEVLEPLSREQEELIARVWHRPEVSEMRVPSRVFFHASILHYLAGNRGMAVSRTKDWLAQLRLDEKNEREQAQVQLNALERIH
jgi:hypothetical protein